MAVGQTRIDGDFLRRAVMEAAEKSDKDPEALARRKELERELSSRNHHVESI